MREVDAKHALQDRIVRGIGGRGTRSGYLSVFIAAKARRLVAYGVHFVGT